MQLQFRIDANNYATFTLKLQSASGQEYGTGPEVIAAVCSDKQLSNIAMDQLLSLVGATLDHVEAVQQPASPEVTEDWHPGFRRGDTFPE